MKTLRYFGFAFLVFVPFVVLACSDDDTTSSDGTPATSATTSSDQTPTGTTTATSSSGGSESEVCAAVAGLDTAVTQLASIDAQSTVDELRSAVDDVVDAYEDFKNAAGDELETAGFGEVAEAVDSLKSTRDGLGGDETLGSVLQGIQNDVAVIVQAPSLARTSFSCPN